MGYASEDYDYADAMGCYSDESAEYYKKKLEHAAGWFCLLDTELRSITPMNIDQVERAMEEIASALDCGMSDTFVNVIRKPHPRVPVYAHPIKSQVLKALSLKAVI